ncbi:telomere repeats-binding bouquet formation protein 1 isoform X3 [Lepisosteus oculatus]|uniref:telomere repeats-binding bouquet formation protein 1 isoform X3 n=1 Tax=Lepisosteus oculatus TaxID=7918 RepID=UPI0035F522D0
MDVSDKEVELKLCGLKTDINLLIECLKYQMDDPHSQKQVLVTIHSICQQNGGIVDYVREIGGVMFVYKLFKSVQNSEVKEAALFALGGFAEKNDGSVCLLLFAVFCQQELCNSEFLAELAQSLSQDSSLNLRRVAVYMISVLVSNNKSGQSLVKTTGCIDILLNLFRTCFPISEKNIKQATISQYFCLWTSVSSALCSCVNNPQNEENQQICTVAFPVSNEWLQKHTRRDILQPICSFIGLTVANNSCAQRCFATSGGLVTLVQALVQQASQSNRSPSACDLAIMMTKTLCACIADNAPLGSGLSQYRLVPRLLSLLSCTTLDPQDLLCIVLTLGYCAEACEEHQVQLLQSGGLPKMIQLLTEPQEEEVKKAATFVLQTCKQITEKLAVGLNSQSWDSRNELDSYKTSAEEMLRRFDAIKKQYSEGLHRNDESVESLGDEFCNSRHQKTSSCGMMAEVRQNSPLQLPVEAPYRTAKGSDEERDRLFQWYKTVKANRERASDYTAPKGTGKETNGIIGSQTRDQKVHMDQGQIIWANKEQQGAASNPAAQHYSVNREEVGRSSGTSEPQGGAVCSGDYKKHNISCGALKRKSSLPTSLPVLGQPETLREQDRDHRYPARDSQRQVVFKHPAPLLNIDKKQKKIVSVKDPIVICSEILDNEISNILKTPASVNKYKNFRCSGCVTGVRALNSRNFSQILRSCQYKCERHMVLLEAEDRYKKGIGKLLEQKRNKLDSYRQISLTPLKKQTSFKKYPKNLCDKAEGKCLNWIQNGRRPIAADCQEKENGNTYSSDESIEPCFSESARTQVATRRQRKNFTEKEVQYLLDGVKKLGPRWNSILWSYPFQSGRTNVDLAKKYSKLQKEKQD